MLGRDLLRVRLKEGRIEPIWLGTTPSVRDLAEQLLTLWRSSVGGVALKFRISSRPLSNEPVHKSWAAG